MPWSLMEFDIRRKVSRSTITKVLQIVFSLHENQIVDRELLYTVLNIKKQKEVKMGFTIINRSSEFQTLLTLELLMDCSDAERIRVGCELARRLNADVLAGDYTNRCEFLLIDKTGLIYYTLATQMGDRIINIVKSHENGINYESFIELYPD